MVRETQDRTEPGSIEVLDLEPAFLHDHNAKEYLRIAVVPEDIGTISLVTIHFDKDWKITCPQICLNREEIDIVITALEKAKQRIKDS